LSPFFFDLLHVDGEDLIDRPTAETAPSSRSSWLPTSRWRCASAIRGTRA
jgi:hypothetical protein